MKKTMWIAIGWCVLGVACFFTSITTADAEVARLMDMKAMICLTTSTILSAISGLQEKIEAPHNKAGS